MKKIKILFLIHSLIGGGAEKVLINLVNNLNRAIFDISVTVLMGGGVNEKFLDKNINFNVVFPKIIPGNSHLMKIMTPEQLHKLCVKEEYDIEISYLEGPSARVISGCKNYNTKLVSWIHVEQHSIYNLSKSFRNSREAKLCYEKFHKTIFVSKNVQDDFCRILDFKRDNEVLYNTVESKKIISLSKEDCEVINNGVFNLVAVGTLKASKGYDRLLRIVKRLKEKGYSVRLYILGTGPLEKSIKSYIAENGLHEHIVLLGYQENPYKYMARCDMFICASHAEGFSTAATEALILGIPVCTVDVSGMKEMLGYDNEYGIVTENNEDALYVEIEKLLKDSSYLEYYTKKAKMRGKMFETRNTVSAVEKMLEDLYRS